jgi:hypothetical protein
MRIEEALSQVRSIQLQLARTRQYCCYRSATVAFTGFLALGAAFFQAYRITAPVEDLEKYLLLWMGVAAVSVLVVGLEVLVRWHRTDSPHARQQTVTTVGQFLPCIVAGAATTWGIAAFCPQHAALLPALWSVIFSLGIFASARHLPTGSLGVALYYLIAGLVCLRWGQAQQALRPWTMVITFAVGQWITAVVLYRQQERDDETA